MNGRMQNDAFLVNKRNFFNFLSDQLATDSPIYPQKFWWMSNCTHVVFFSKSTEDYLSKSRLGICTWQCCGIWSKYSMLDFTTHSWLCILLIPLPPTFITQDQSRGWWKCVVVSRRSQRVLRRLCCSTTDTLTATVSRADCSRRSGARHLGGNPSLEVEGEVSIVSPLKQRLCCFSPGFSFILDTCRGKQSLTRIDSWIYSRTGCGGESHL